MDGMIYQFDPADARRFAADQGIRTRERGDQLQFARCPYCRNKTDDQNTFAISLKTGQFNCLRATCGAKGNMITLHKDFGFSLGKNVDAYFNRDKFRDLSRYGRPEVRTPAVEYMGSRGISRKVTEKYSISTQAGHDNILIFPFYDEDGVLQFVKYRKTDFNKNTDKNKEWCVANCKPILFGMDQVPKDEKTLVITEGQIDSLSVCQALGKSVAVSVPTGARGFTWIPYCWDFLSRFETLIVFGDFENGRITLLDELKSRFHGMTKHVRLEDYKDCKDANELLMKYGEQAVENAVKNATIVKNPHIKKLSEVKRDALADADAIDSGFNALNRITGGFFPGQLVILTGERGLGKSTLGNQFILEAVRQGYPSLIYSGELNDWQVQEWIDRQAAGPDHINKQETRLESIRYRVDANAEQKIHAWYDDLLYIRDNMADGAEPESLSDTLRTAVTRYGIRVLLVDNMMTAIEDDTAADFWRMQASFARELTKMAKTYGVLTILVVHPRKRISAEFTNDDVAGSGNITNLADLVIRYDRPKDHNTDEPRILAVTKNRATGIVNYKGISLYFEESSKRISERQDGFEREYGWETEEDFWKDGVPDDIPF